jgi:CMP-N-acetylneuraminic acid synthetase
MFDRLLIVPARGGSKGIKNKNLSKVNDISLINRSLTHAIQLSECASIILSTDSYAILKEVSDYFLIDFDFEKENQVNTIIPFGKFYLHFRGNDLSDDEAIISDVLFSIRSILRSKQIKTKIWCILQPTSPYRSKLELEEINEIIKDNNNFDFSLVSATQVTDIHPARMYELDKNSFLNSLPIFENLKQLRRQDLPVVYIRDGGFYILGDNLVSKKIQFSVQPKAFIRNFPWNINIDSKIDLYCSRAVNKLDTIGDPNDEL